MIALPNRTMFCSLRQAGGYGVFGGSLRKRTHGESVANDVVFVGREQLEKHAWFAGACEGRHWSLSKHKEKEHSKRPNNFAYTAPLSRAISIIHSVHRRVPREVAIEEEKYVL